MMPKKTRSLPSSKRFHETGAAPIRLGTTRGHSVTIRLVLLCKLLCAMLLPGMAMAQEQAPQCRPKTAGYFKEQSIAAAGALSPLDLKGITSALTASLGDPQRGRGVVIDAQKGNCIACHRIAALSQEPSHGDLGPSLNGAGLRFTEAQLRQIVTNPGTFFPNTVMPGYYVSEGLERVPSAYAGKTILSAAEVEDVVAFMKTLR